MEQEKSKSIVICVLGMHRSGTSMVTRLLNICGVSLGDDRLLPINLANKKGYWEDRAVMQINDKILNVFEGSWDKPPIFPKDWENDKRLDDLYKEAQDFIDDMNQKSNVWGFKDPRTCLTLPFWQKLIPDMKYVIPVRFPQEVAMSLHKRDGITLSEGLLLYLSYWDSIFKYTKSSERCFTFFDSYFVDWKNELEEMLKCLDIDDLSLKGNEKEIEDFISDKLRNNKVEKGINQEKITQEYITNLVLQSFSNKKVDKDEKFYLKEEQIKELQNNLQQQAQQLDQKQQMIQQRDSELNQKQQMIQQRDSELNQKQQIIQQKIQELNRANEKVEQKDVELQQKEQQIKTMQSSKFWKMRNVYIHYKNGIKQGIKNPKLFFVFLKKRYLKIFFKKRVHQKDVEFFEKINPTEDFNPKISVIVPNFNHEKFLYKRLKSIYSQTYKNFEVIILDDKSEDNSVKIIKKFVKKFPKITKMILNKKNSGSVFNQWEKGINLASGDIIWIAESDDYCDRDFLEKMIYYFYDESIILSYSHQVFVNEKGKKNDFSFEDYVKILDKNKWKNSYIEAAHTEVKDALGMKNTIPNVSGVLMRANYVKKIDFDMLKKFKVCGDWYLYLSILRGGRLAYCVETNNYYRFHSNNTSSDYQCDIGFVREHKKIARFIAKNYLVSTSVLNKQRQYVFETWLANKGDKRAFDEVYDTNEVLEVMLKRKPNIMIAIFAFSTGGGEVVPIRLANEFKRNGYIVTIFDYCAFGRKKETVRNMLDDNIPVFRSTKIEEVDIILDRFGINIVNTHHLTVDKFFVSRKNKTVKQVITMHGMYDYLNYSEMHDLQLKYNSKVAHWIYVADKNINAFQKNNWDITRKSTKIYNGFSVKDNNVINRNSLGIDDEDFVVCLASRAIKEKGWYTAIEAIKKANSKSSRKLKLLLVGDGPIYDELVSSDLNNDIVLMGFRSDVARIYQMSDIGLLPTVFNGESCPLTLIECISLGRPFIISDVGEARQMLANSDGTMAGVLLSMDGENVDVNEVAEVLIRLANDRSQYKKLLNNVQKCSKKFNMSEVVRKYENIFKLVYSKYIRIIYFDGKKIIGEIIDFSKSEYIVHISVNNFLLVAIKTNIEQGNHRVFRFTLRNSLLKKIPKEAKLCVQYFFSETLPVCCNKYENKNMKLLGQANNLNKLKNGFANGLYVEKGGQLVKSLSVMKNEHFFIAYNYINNIFKQKFNYTLLLAYGTLLGYERTGDFIAHDNDYDLCYISRKKTAREVVEEMLGIVNFLQSEGEEIKVVDGAQFHWFVDIKKQTRQLIDIFVGWVDDDGYNQYFAIGKMRNVSAIKPIKKVTFKNHEVYIPNKPAVLLREIYGEVWRIPDPYFNWSGRKRSAIEKANDIQNIYKNIINQK